MTRTPLRIGITCYPTFGGSGVIATEVGMAMARKGHRVHFVCSDVPRRLDRFMDNIFFHEVEVHNYPLFVYPPYSLSLTSKMVEVATFEKLDLLHVHYAVPHATSAYLAKKVLGPLAPKIITTLHGTDITLVGNERSYLPITRFSIVESDGITAPSYYLKNATYDKLNVSTEVPIEVIPNFVDSVLFCPPADGSRAALAGILGTCVKNDRIVTHVSNFRPVKRIQDVIKIFAQIHKEVPAYLIMVGDGPERSKAEDTARELGIQDRVCFLGKQENFVPILQHSDLFLLPSESESFGLAALEAMSCGVPVVASKIHGLPEVVIPGVNGFLAAVGDIEGMARHGIEILQNQNLRLKLGQNARSIVLEKYREEIMTARYEDYYYKILGRDYSKSSSGGAEYSI